MSLKNELNEIKTSHVAVIDMLEQEKTKHAGVIDILEQEKNSHITTKNELLAIRVSLHEHERVLFLIKLYLGLAAVSEQSQVQ